LSTRICRSMKMAPEKEFFPRKLPSQERSKDTVEAILTAATHIFSELGYAACTTNKIAVRAGVSIGSLYQYFPNKDAIIVSLTERMFREGLKMTEAIVKDTENSQATFRQKLRRFIEGMVALHMKNPKLHKILTDHAPNLHVLSDTAWQYEKEFSRMFTAMVDKEPYLRVTNLSLSATFVMLLTDAICHWLIQLHLQFPEENKDPENLKQRQGFLTQIIDELEDVLFRYLIK